MKAWICRMTFGILAGIPPDAHATTPAVDTIVVVCFGNSTTAVRKGLSKPYPERLADRYRAQNIPAKVFNAGRGGNHTGSTGDNAFHKGPHAKDRFLQDVIRQDPDLMVICFGINDAWQDEGKRGPSRISAGDYRKNLLGFQQELGRRGGETIFLGPNPLGSKYPSFRMHRLRKYHRITRRVARSTRSEWINTFQLFKKNPPPAVASIDQLLMDGMHPNDAGQEIIAEAIWQALISKQ